LHRKLKGPFCPGKDSLCSTAAVEVVEHGVLSKKLLKEIIIVIILRSQRQTAWDAPAIRPGASECLGTAHASIVNDGRQFNSANNIVLNAQLCK
jgi:hypothetical protein